VHEVAQREAPESRVVYVDRDPILLAHAHQLLRGTPEGATSYVFGELREPGAILRAAAGTLDFSRPVAVMLFGILHFFSDRDDPRAVVGQLAASLTSGSYLGAEPSRPRRGGRGAGRDVPATQRRHGRVGQLAQP
jgi:hypothetical protein